MPELVTHARKKIPGHVRWGIVLLSALVSRPTDGRYYVRDLDKRAMVEKVWVVRESFTLALPG